MELVEVGEEGYQLGSGIFDVLLQDLLLFLPD